jgi:acetyl esterase
VKKANARSRERAEKVLMSPAIWFQAHGDTMHDYKDTESDFDGNEPQRFCVGYRKAGGSIALEYVDMERKAGSSPDLSKCGDMFGRMVEFVGRHVRV